jgi:hypothetical protein
MDRSQLTEISEDLEEIHEKLFDYTNLFMDIHEGSITGKKNIRTVMDYVLGYSPELGDIPDSEISGEKGYGYLLKELERIVTEIKRSLRKHKTKSQIRVVRFPGQPLLQPPAPEETVQVVVNIPKKLAQRLVKEYGYERFDEDLFDFCEREGWDAK